MKNKPIAADCSDELLFCDEDDDTETIVDKTISGDDRWKVLIVDDEEDVHVATKIVLKDFVFDGRSIHFLSAFTEQEARHQLDTNPDIALIFLDVVLGLNDSGINLIAYTREILGNKLVRIILRTGQPGRAPEEDVILNYDINDYREKSSLTSQKLFTAVVAALRAYKSIVELDQLNRALTSEVDRRTQAEASLKTAYDDLENQVAERTDELTDANRKLLAEIETRQKLENELINSAKLESIGLLAGGIAHDFNNLLTGIVGNISMAKSVLAPNNAKALNFIEKSIKASRRARDLTLQLLTFSKGGSPIRTTISTKKMIEETAEFCLHGSKVKLTCDVPNDIHPVSADAGQVSRVIQNLIINADQAMPNGGEIRLSAENITVRPEDPVVYRTGNYVRISVTDTGSGISEENRRKVLEPFFTTKGGQSGLGLTTAQSIIRNHGGYLEIESGAEKCGTTVNLYLVASNEAVTDIAVDPQPRDRKHGNILVMDDQEYVCEIVNEILTDAGYVVESTADGKAAVARFRRAQNSGAPFDAVILDLTIPGGMGGQETIQALRNLDPQVKGIVSSGYSNDEVLSNYRDYGFCAIVPKPYEDDDLVRVVDEVVGNKTGQYID